jgi:DNA-binding CsgD family transcriptional regulator
LQNKEIAARLGMSERTVKSHMGAIFRKLGAGNRTEAVALALQRHLVEPPR